WFFFSSRRRHTRLQGDWSSDVCSSDLHGRHAGIARQHVRQTQFFQDLTDVLARNPGVAAVSVSRTLPLTGGVDILAFDPRRIRPDATEEYLAARLSVVGPGYFAAMGIRLRGRDFTPQDRADAPKVVIMNRRLSDA